MSMRYMTSAAKIAAVLLATGSAASAMEVTFDWSNLPVCTDGVAMEVTNPQFSVRDIPAETVTLRFKLVDLDAPKFKHGGGYLKNDNTGVIRAGRFKYLRPCPPAGVSHRYQWTVSAVKLDKVTQEKTVTGTATSIQMYP